jgi:hypothetical protein
MTRQRLAGSGITLGFKGSYAIAEATEVALEDYARALTGAQGAEALHPDGEPTRVWGVRVYGAAAPTREVLEDLEAFARELARPPEKGRPGAARGW